MADNIEDDILIEIPDNDLPELAELYKSVRKTIPYAYNHILTGIDWKKKGRKNYMRYFSPNSCWREDGTFITIIHCFSNHILIFSLDKSGKNIYEAIKNTNRIQYDSPMETLFYAVNSNYRNILIRSLNDKITSFKIIELPADIMCLGKEDAEHVDVDLRNYPDLYIKKIDASFAPLIDSLWPHRYDGSVRYIRSLIELNDGYGLFLKSNDQLVAWCLISVLGQLATLQTAENHKRKGYASLITKVMIKEMTKKGLDTLGTIAVGNTAAKNMFEKLGFSCIGQEVYVTLLKN